jgi:MYXO-CTERM domain-containing protein
MGNGMGMGNGLGMATPVVGASTTGSMSMQIMEQRAVNSENGDSGYISNIYGRNPNNQGRDFLRCIANVANPGYGVANGFMPNVKSFIAAPHGGRKSGDPKNSLFLSLMPGEVDAPQPPDKNPVTGDNGTGIPGGPDNPGTGTGTPGNPGSPGGIDPTGQPGTPGNGTGAPNANLSGCQMGGTPHAGLTMLGLIGLALVASRRRRSR